MQIKIVRIGNSKGLRLSKTILDKYNIHESVELVLKDEFIELRPIKKSRSGWNEKFRKMNEFGDDDLLIDDVFEDEEIE
jgi:antitoxin MazE